MLGNSPAVVNEAIAFVRTTETMLLQSLQPMGGAKGTQVNPKP